MTDVEDVADAVGAEGAESPVPSPTPVGVHRKWSDLSLQEKLEESRRAKPEYGPASAHPGERLEAGMSEPIPCGMPELGEHYDSTYCETHRHPCLAVSKSKLERDYSKMSLPYSEKDPLNDAHWLRRTMTPPGCNFLGDVHYEITDRFAAGLFAGTKQISLPTAISFKLQALTKMLSGMYMFENNVSAGCAIDLMFRWFCQHPPQRAWIRAYIAKYSVEHKRGMKPKERSRDPKLLEFDAVKAGYDSAEHMLEQHRKRWIGHLRMLRMILEYRDLTFDEASGGLLPEWIQSDGTVKIPVDKKDVDG